MTLTTQDKNEIKAILTAFVIILLSLSAIVMLCWKYNNPTL